MISAADYINEVNGKPWVAGASGPDAYDCWGIIVDSFNRIDGIKLPALQAYSLLDLELGMIEAIRKGAWEKLDAAADGCVIACFKGDRLDHVGRYFYGRMLHARGRVGSHGEVCMWPLDLAEKTFDKVEFYAWR